MGRQWATRRPGLGHGLMVLSGLLTFVLVAGALRDDDVLVDVLVVESDVAAGTRASEIPLSPVGLPADAARRLGLVEAGAVEDSATVLRPIRRGEPLRASDLTGPPDGGTGRTMVVPVERIMLEGLGLRVGDRVDLIAVSNDGRSRFAAVDVEVVRLPAPRDAGGLARSVESAAQWLTLAVDDGQALELAAASSTERLAVVRSTGVRPPVVLERTIEPHRTEVDG